MPDPRSRLAKCFSAVFPDLTEDQVGKASLETVEAWDSLATVTLLSVIEEEFAVQLDPGDLEHLVSFESVLAHLQTTKGVT